MRPPWQTGMSVTRIPLSSCNKTITIVSNERRNPNTCKLFDPGANAKGSDHKFYHHQGTGRVLLFTSFLVLLDKGNGKSYPEKPQGTFMCQMTNFSNNPVSVDLIHGLGKINGLLTVRKLTGELYHISNISGTDIPCTILWSFTTRVLSTNSGSRDAWKIK